MRYVIQYYMSADELTLSSRPGWADAGDWNSENRGEFDKLSDAKAELHCRQLFYTERRYRIAEVRGYYTWTPAQWNWTTNSTP